MKLVSKTYVLMIILLFSLLACYPSGIFINSSSPTEAPAITPTTDRSLCFFMWATGPDEASQAKLEAMLQNLDLDFTIGTMGGYGEDEVCQQPDGTDVRRFLIMDISPQIQINSLEAEATNVDVIYAIVSELATTEMRTVRELTIVLPEDILWRAVLNDIRSLIDNGATPEQIYAAGLLE